MKVSAWSNGRNGYGIRVGMPNRRKYFDPVWKEIIVEIEGDPLTFALTDGFWHKCPEFRDRSKPVIRGWLEQQRAIPWEPGRPPVFELLPLGGNRFALKRIPGN